MEKNIHYVSLFSGIGGFEVGIKKNFDNAVCLGFSEIDKHALQIYYKNFPDHKNLGDITMIKKQDICSLGKIDIVVSGFPCTNLSSLSNIRGDNRGLDAPKSGLFYDMIRVLKYCFKKNPKLKFIIENNNSMKLEQKNLITRILNTHFKNIYSVVIDNSIFGVQKRKRIIWTNFYVEKPNIKDIQKKQTIQTWKDILQDKKDVLKYSISKKMIECLNKTYPIKNKKETTKIVFKHKCLYEMKDIKLGNFKSRWDIQKRSDLSENKSRTITSGSGGGNNILIDRRFGLIDTDRLTYSSFFIVRKFTPIEIERLFGFPDNWTDTLSETARKKVLGNSIPIFIVCYVLSKLQF